MTHPTRRPARPAPHHRRGSVYAMVLGISMLITVIGIGALATSRVTSRAVGVSNDWVESGSIAFSAVEHAVAKVNADAALAPATWRNAFTSGAAAFSGNFGRGDLKWVLVDEDDGLIGDDYGETLRLYGIGKVGATRRTYSVELSPTGQGMEVLRTAVHASGGVVIGGSALVIGGPVSTNGTLTGAAGIRGDGGTEVAGYGSPIAAAKAMPAASTFNLYTDPKRATPIDPGVADGGTFSPGTLSAADNPYGAENKDGIYYLKLSASVSTLSIEPSRFKATLVIEAPTGGGSRTVLIKAPTLWEPHRADLPILIIKGVQTVRFYGAIAGYGGETSELKGLIHVIGSSNVYLEDATFIRGCLVADGVVTTSGTVGLTAARSLYTAPPPGYTKGNQLVTVGGSWKWDAPPAGVN